MKSVSYALRRKIQLKIYNNYTKLDKDHLFYWGNWSDGLDPHNKIHHMLNFVSHGVAVLY